MTSEKADRKNLDITVDFGSRFAASELFMRIYEDGMTLVEETAAYLDGAGRHDARGLGGAASIAYATESMRLTTRLMQLASWLLLQRAVREGEMTKAEARREKKRIDLSGLGPGEMMKGADELPKPLVDLINRSLRLHERIERLDTMLNRATVADEKGSSPVRDQIAQLENSLAQRGT